MFFDSAKGRVLMENSKEFKYMEIADLLKKKIQDGSYKLGELIPSQRTVAAQLNVNRVSIKRAIQQLEKEGVVECIPSVGTIVRKIPSGKTLIGYLVRSLKDPFHLEMIREMDKLLAIRDAGLIVAEGESANRLIEMGAERIVKAGQLEHTAEEDIVGTVYIGSEGIAKNSIAIDNRKGMVLIFNHLRELGHKRIAFVSTAIENLAAQPDMRFHYLKDSADEKEIKKYIEEHSFFIQSYSEKECEDVVQRILELEPWPTAIVCSSDWLAIEILQQILFRDVKVPDEISITGFDNIYMSGIINIPLTTVSFPIPFAAKGAVDILFDKSNKKEHHIICEPELVKRKSTGEALTASSV